MPVSFRARTRLGQPAAFRGAVFAALFVGLSGCVTPVETPVGGGPDADELAPVATTPRTGVSVESFAAVVARMEPMAEALCRAEAPRANCDYKVVVDRNPKSPPNAFQSETPAGRPTLTFTVSLIADVANVDELAFIFGHEAAHHISGHLGQTQGNAIAGGIVGGLLGAALGADAGGLEALQNLGATVGARAYSKNFELEADALGTVIAARAGYNPVRGAAYFTRIPDPGNQCLGSRPPNAARIETVRRTMANL